MKHYETTTIIERGWGERELNGEYATKCYDNNDLRNSPRLDDKNMFSNAKWMGIDYGLGSGSPLHTGVVVELVAVDDVAVVVVEVVEVAVFVVDVAVMVVVVLQDPHLRGEKRH